jgi:hypothetical protein
MHRASGQRWDRPGAVRRRRILVVAGVALCAWSGWASGYHRTTTPAEITWVVTLVAVALVDWALWRGRRGSRFGWSLEPVTDPWPRPGRGGKGPALRGVGPWLVLIVVILVWEVLGIDTGPRQYHLTVSALAQAYRPMNAALLLVWVLVGVGYQAARVRAPDHDIGTRDGEANPDAPARGGVPAVVMASVGGHHAAPGLLLPQSPSVGVAFWVAVPLAALLVDLAARRSGGRRANAEEFVRFVSTSVVANIALIAAWVFAGYHLFAR